MKYLNKLVFVFLITLNFSYSQPKKTITPELIIKDIKIQEELVINLIYSFKKIIYDEGFENLSKKIPANGHLDGRINVNFLNIDNGVDEMYKGTIAIALGSGDDSQINLIFDYINWKRLNDNERLATVLHELSHDAFNFKHVEWDELSLMHPYSQPKSEKTLVIMLKRMLDNYKYGNYEMFKSDELYIHNNSKASKTKTYNKQSIF